MLKLFWLYFILSVKLMRMPGLLSIETVVNLHFAWLQKTCNMHLLSQNHLPHQLNQPPTPAHNHQSTNHEHLQSLTTTIQKLTHLTHSSAGLKVASYSMLVDAYLSARPSWNPACGNASLHTVRTVHSASSASFISLMLEAQPWLYWINYLLTCIYLSVSLTSV